MTYEPKPGSQFQPVTPLSPSDCVPATCALGVDRASVGAIRVTHKEIRAASTDQYKGMTFTDAAAATYKVTKVKGEPRFGLSRAEVNALVRGGHALSIGINCAVTVNTKYRTNLYTGLHAVFMQSYYSSDDTYKIEDPGTTAAGYLYWPATLLYKAAESFTGGHGINVIVWPDTEGTTKLGATAGKVRAAPTVTAPVKASIVLGKAYTVVSSLNGGTWHTKDGKAADGWWKIKWGTGFAYSVGERLA